MKEKLYNWQGIDMPQIVRKPPTGKNDTERLKISFLGAHNFEDATSMFLQVMGLLESKGFTHVSDSDFYLRLITPDLHPLAYFPDGSPIGEHLIRVDNPYRCAADEYDRRFSLHPPARR